MRSPRPSLLPAWSTIWLPLAVAIVLIFTAQATPDFYRQVVLPENGLLESLHILIPLVSLILAIRILFLAPVRGSLWLKLWFGFAAVALFYIAGEEASWGQHLFAWDTPDFVGSLNDQDETNLHNTSAWLDQKPRLLLEVSEIIGGLLLPLALLRWPGLGAHKIAIVFPTTGITLTVILAEFALASEYLFESLDMPQYLFHRATEVQEFYFYYFVLLYLIEFRLRLVARLAAKN